MTRELALAVTERVTGTDAPGLMLPLVALAWSQVGGVFGFQLTVALEVLVKKKVDEPMANGPPSAPERATLETETLKPVVLSARASIRLMPLGVPHPVHRS